MRKYRIETLVCVWCQTRFDVAYLFFSTDGCFGIVTKSCCPGCSCRFVPSPSGHPNAYPLSMAEVFVPDGFLLPIDEREELSGLTLFPVDTGVKGTA